jgi:hypothetical protein
MDDKSRKRLSRSAARRDGRSPENAVQSAASREIVLNESAKSNHRERFRTAHHRHPAGRSQYDVPPILRPCLHLGSTPLLSVCELVLPTVLWRRVLRIWTWDQHGPVFRRRLGWLGRMGVASRVGQPQRDGQQQLHSPEQFQRIRQPEPEWKHGMVPQFRASRGRTLCELRRVQPLRRRSAPELAIPRGCGTGAISRDLGTVAISRCYVLIGSGTNGQSADCAQLLPLEPERFRRRSGWRCSAGA